jgi:hypothetical protein
MGFLNVVNGRVENTTWSRWTLRVVVVIQAEGTWNDVDTRLRCHGDREMIVRRGSWLLG